MKYYLISDPDGPRPSYVLRLPEEPARQNVTMTWNRSPGNANRACSEIEQLIVEVEAKLNSGECELRIELKSQWTKAIDSNVAGNSQKEFNDTLPTL